MDKDHLEELLETLDKRVTLMEAKIDIILAFVENVEGAFEQMQTNPMFKSLVGTLG